MLLVQSFSYLARMRNVHKKSPNIDHNNREKNSIFRKKDARRETKIWAKMGGTSARLYKLILSILGLGDAR